MAPQSAPSLLLWLALAAPSVIPTRVPKVGEEARLEPPRPRRALQVVRRAGQVLEVRWEHRRALQLSACHCQPTPPTAVPIDGAHRRWRFCSHEGQGQGQDQDRAPTSCAADSTGTGTGTGNYDFSSATSSSRYDRSGVLMFRLAAPASYFTLPYALIQNQC